MNKLLGSPNRSKNAGRAPSGVLDVLSMHAPVPMGRDPLPPVRAPCVCTTLAVCFANCIAIRLRIALDPTSLRFFMNSPG